MIEQKTVGAVDDFIQESLLKPDPVLERALQRAAAADLPPHAVSPTRGAFLQIIARAMGAKRILEIGTLGGYSTIWLARALPAEGRLITLEQSPVCVGVAAKNVKDANLDGSVSIVLGPALDSLDALIRAKTSAFDLIFIDADKPNNPVYLERCLQLSRPGTVIIGDNVVRAGALADAASDDPKVQGVRRFLRDQGREPGLQATALQTLDGKGYDGFSMAIVG
ncbi:MAG: O-methyltransferase [Kiloniellales bacterium]